jgi:hypothetical protein
MSPRMIDVTLPQTQMQLLLFVFLDHAVLI